MPSWRLADRTLDLETPGTVVGVGIVNVTVDSMFEGARSGTPEQAVADGLALAEAGFEMLDVGAVAAKAGPRSRRRTRPRPWSRPSRASRRDCVVSTL
jgi:dihydropteroate synthase